MIYIPDPFVTENLIGIE